MSNEELQKLVESNAKAIEALASAAAEDRKEYKKDRVRLYEAMSRMAAAQSTFWEIQADYYRRLDEMDERQAQIIEILNRLTPKDGNS